MNRDVGELCSKLRDYLPEGGNITGLTPLTSGHSNETYVVEGLNAILRLPPSSAPLVDGHGIVSQARIYDQIGRLQGAPPVPEIHCICDDPDVLGDPFFVMEFVHGRAIDDYQLPQWFTMLTDEQRGELCGNWVAAIGSIARLPTIEALGERRTPEGEMRRWRGMALGDDCPRLAGLIERLLAFPAPRSGPPAPVQGDCKITNMLFDGLQVSAVLDWELGYNGEPLSDLGYLLYFFSSEFHGNVRTTKPPGMWQRDQVIAGWERASGRSSHGLIWFETAEMGKMAGIYARAMSLYSVGDGGDPRMQIMADKLEESMDIMDAMLAQVAETLA